MRVVRRRSGIVATALLAGTVALSGCSSPVACSAIGWMNRLVVEVSGPQASGVDVELCVDDRCAPRDADVGAFGGSVRRTHDGSTWTFVAFVYPASFDVRAFTAHGVEVARATVTPRWVSNATGPCPGPSSATVDLAL